MFVVILKAEAVAIGEWQPLVGAGIEEGKGALQENYTTLQDTTRRHRRWDRPVTGRPKMTTSATFRGGF